MKRKFIFLITLIFALGGVKSSLLNAQENQEQEVIIGEITDDHNGYGLPFEPYDEYSYSQSIYLHSEIGKDITIDKIAYHVASMDNQSIERTLEVYLTEISEIYFVKLNNNKSYNITINSQPVFKGTVTVKKGWLEIDITNYEYKVEEGNNLLITINDITGSKDSGHGDNNMKFSYYTSSYTTDNTNYYQRSVYQSGSSKYSVNTQSIAIGSKNISPTIKLIPPSAVVNEVGNLKGAVKNGETPISGATVKLTDEKTATTGDDGSFSFENITVGTYDLTVQASDFEDYVVKNVIINNGETTDAVIYLPTIITSDENGNWIETNATLTENNEVIIRTDAKLTKTKTIKTLTIEYGISLTISNGATLIVIGEINKEKIANNLIIEDGGQIFQTNDGVQAMFNMGIINPTEWSGDNNADGWQLISSPFTDASVSYFTSTTDEYDLYKFDGNQVSEEWRNHKAQANNGFETEFVPGRAYLASYKTKDVASISGTLCNKTVFNVATTTDNDDATIDYVIGDYQYNNNLKDFHLIGNPFPFDMDMSKLNDMTYHIIEGYAVVNDGAYLYSNFTGTVKAGDGFFIKTNGKNPSLYYSHSSSKSRSEETSSINIIATGNNGSDNLIISLSGAENEGFNKLENFNKDIATVFVVKNDTRYGIANFDNDVTMIDVAFEAKEMGNYTIAAQPNGKFKTLTLVDRFTGVETNLLVEDYHFTATSNDNYNRFIVKLVNGQQTTDNSHFAYVSGEDLILDIEGSVQIIDMMGRVIYANDVIGDNNRINVSELNNAAYIVRVVNEEGVKVQKVVIY